MAAKSDGNDNPRDHFNWALLSHSYDHQPDRRGRGRYNSSRRYGDKSIRGARGHTKTWKVRDKGDAHRNSNDYEDQALSFYATNKGYKDNGNNTDMLYSESRDRRQGKQYYERGMRRSDRTSASWGINKKDHFVQDSDAKTQAGKLDTLQDSSVSDEKVNSFKLNMLDGKSIHNRKKDAIYYQRRSGEQGASRSAGSSDFSSVYGKNQGNGRYPKRRIQHSRKPIDSEQARVLTEQLIEESYECMVCCEFLRSSQTIWCCQNCYHIFHLRCIKQWVKSSSASLKGKSCI